MRLSEFKNLIREEVRKIVYEADGSDWANAPDVPKSLAFLKTKLSPEGYRIVLKFADDADVKTPYNARSWKVRDLAWVFGRPVKRNAPGGLSVDKIGITKSLSLGDLAMYSNKTLYKLITDTGDLVPHPTIKGRYIPASGIRN